MSECGSTSVQVAHKKVGHLFGHVEIWRDLSFGNLGIGLGGGEGGAASWGGGAVDGGSVNAFLAAALTRVMCAAVPVPTVASASVFHSAAGGGSVVDVVRPL